MILGNMIHAKRSDGIITVCRRKCGFLSHVVKQFRAVVYRVRLMCVVGYFGEMWGGGGGQWKHMLGMSLRSSLLRDLLTSCRVCPLSVLTTCTLVTGP